MTTDIADPILAAANYFRNALAVANINGETEIIINFRSEADARAFENYIKMSRKFQQAGYNPLNGAGVEVYGIRIKISHPDRRPFNPGQPPK